MFVTLFGFSVDGDENIANYFLTRGRVETRFATKLALSTMENKISGERDLCSMRERNYYQIG